MNVSLVVLMISARFWHEAPLAQREPLNDLKLSKASISKSSLYDCSNQK